MPIQYLGGKARLAKKIVAIVDEGRAADEPLWDLCCGSGRVIAAASDRGPRYGVDVVPSLVRLLSEVRDGTFVPPTEVTREQYAALKQRAADDVSCDDPLLAFAGFGLAFAGQWFSGYATNKRGDDYLGAATRNCAHMRLKLRGVEFVCADWRTIVDRVSGTVYIDPPYAGTTGYKAAPPHDPAEFWRSVDALVERSEVRAVYVSEYAAPEHWREVARWEGQKAINRGTRVERLFTRSRSC
jgi:site-specific DNA-adenine methylase